MITHPEGCMVHDETNQWSLLESNVVSNHKCHLPTSVNHWLLIGLICALTLLSWNGPAWAGPVENTESKTFIAKQLTFAAGFESNRTLGDHWALRGSYQLESQGKYRVQTGLSYNQATGYINALFIDLGYEKINNSRYSFRIKFLGNQYPEYNKAVNSIIPYMHWDKSSCFIEAGLNFRFINYTGEQMWNIFYYETDLAESIPYYQFGLRIPLQNSCSTLTAAFKNCDEMYAGNLGAYRFHFNYSREINEHITVYGTLDYWQSGGIVMANTYYKTTFYAGIEVKL